MQEFRIGNEGLGLSLGELEIKSLSQVPCFKRQQLLDSYLSYCSQPHNLFLAILFFLLIMHLPNTVFHNST